MQDPKLITNKLICTNVSIIFFIEDPTSRNISKFTKTLSNIKETASYEDIYNAADSIAKLYDYTKYDVKLISTTLIENDVTKIMENIQMEDNQEENIETTVE